MLIDTTNLLSTEQINSVFQAKVDQAHAQFIGNNVWGSAFILSYDAIHSDLERIFDATALVSKRRIYAHIN